LPDDIKLLAAVALELAEACRELVDTLAHLLQIRDTLFLVV
jgi:hypothetical protein